METSIEKFNPTIAELQKLVENSKQITAIDLDDKKQLDNVKNARISLKNARVAISKTGKELREDALKFQKDIIAKEKELIAIIEPEELRLGAIENEAKEKKLKEERIALLPERKDKLSKIGDGMDVPDEFLLSLDSNQFIEHVNARISAKNEFDRKVLEDRERKAKEEDLRLQREKEVREREEKARQEERAKLEREQKDKLEKEIREKKEQEEREKVEKARLEKEKKYQLWLKENGYTKANANSFLVKDNGSSITLYRLVGTYTK